MEKALEKILCKIVAPSYDIISDVKVVKLSNYGGDLIYYQVVYFFKWDVSFSSLLKLEMETKNLFNMLCPNKNERLAIGYEKNRYFAHLIKY